MDENYFENDEKGSKRPSKKPSGGKQSSTSSLIITIVAAALAAAMAIFAVWFVMNKDKDKNTSSDGTSSAGSSGADFIPSSDLIKECGDAAHDLVAKNYDIIRLFVTEGLPHLDEPYGNFPDDGIYTVNSTDYKELSDIEDLVRSAFVKAEADRILTNINGEGLKVYLPREILVDAEYSDDPEEDESRPLYVSQTVLGISAYFEPDTEYKRDWTSCSIAVMPVSETQCELTIYLGGIEHDDSSIMDDESLTSSNVSSENVLKTSMLKENGEWKLTVFVY